MHTQIDSEMWCTFVALKMWSYHVLILISGCMQPISAILLINQKLKLHHRRLSKEEHRIRLILSGFFSMVFFSSSNFVISEYFVGICILCVCVSVCGKVHWLVVWECILSSQIIQIGCELSRERKIATGKKQRNLKLGMHYIVSLRPKYMRQYSKSVIEIGCDRCRCRCHFHRYLSYAFPVHRCHNT